MWVYPSRLQDFLIYNGLPVVEYNNLGDAYFDRCGRLYDLLTKYTVIYDCIPNRGF